MRKTVLVMIVAAMTLSACSSWRDSRANPTNWFGNSRAAAVDVPGDDANPLVPRRAVRLNREDEDLSVPVQTITDLRIDKTLGGAIIYVTGQARQEGAYDPELRLNNPLGEPDEEGVLAMTFRVVYPRRGSAPGTERTRRVQAAFSVSDQDLEGVRVIRVSGLQNAQESRRR